MPQRRALSHFGAKGFVDSGAGMKKASGKKNKTAKGKKAARKPVQSAPSSKATDMGAVRQKISKIVSGAAENITRKLVTKAKDGDLAHSKYLFEMAGVYPTEEAAGKPPEEESLAKTLLQRMGLPTTPVMDDEDGETRVLVVAEVSKGRADEKIAQDETCDAGVGESAEEE